MLIYRNGVLSNFISESDWYQPFDLGAYYCLAANQDGGTDFYVSSYHSLFWNDSAGGCSDLETYAYCDIPESDCGSATWLEPGAVLDESGCCLCSASCDHDQETADYLNNECYYYDWHYTDDYDYRGSNAPGAPTPQPTEPEEGKCRCCEAVFDVGASECEDGSAFFDALMMAGADNTYSYVLEEDSSMQRCGSCSIPWMAEEECDAIIPDTADEGWGI